MDPGSVSHVRRMTNSVVRTNKKETLKGSIPRVSALLSDQGALIEKDQLMLTPSGFYWIRARHLLTQVISLLPNQAVKLASGTKWHVPELCHPGTSVLNPPCCTKNKACEDVANTQT
jgi:hypothetical protein